MDKDKIQKTECNHMLGILYGETIRKAIQKESEIIIANTGIIIPFLRCKTTHKLKGKLKRKDFLNLRNKPKKDNLTKQRYLDLLKKTKS